MADTTTCPKDICPKDINCRYRLCQLQHPGGRARCPYLKPGREDCATTCDSICTLEHPNRCTVLGCFGEGRRGRPCNGVHLEPLRELRRREAEAEAGRIKEETR